METFEKLLNVNKVNFDSLLSSGFEAANEWLNFYGADIAHANETGEINKSMMRILRKIATGENISGRGIQRNNVKFKNNAVLILILMKVLILVKLQLIEHVQLRLHLRIDRRTKLMKNVIKYLNHFGTLLSLTENSVNASVSF